MDLTPFLTITNEVRRVLDFHYPIEFSQTVDAFGTKLVIRLLYPTKHVQFVFPIPYQYNDEDALQLLLHNVVREMSVYTQTQLSLVHVHPSVN